MTSGDSNGTSSGHGGHVTLEGTIQARNERGVRIDGQWLNLSKYRPIVLPETGARVRAEVDNRGFLCSLEVLESAPVPTVLSRSERDETITRLAVLKAAAQFLGLMSQNRDEIQSAQVLVLADRWLAWVNSSKEEAF